MALYGNLEEYSDNLSEFYEAYGEAMIIAESYIEEEDDILSEGANIEITKKLKEFKERYNKYNKAGKKALLKKDFNTAAENFAKAKKELKEFEYAVKNMDSTVGSAVLGSIAGLLIVMIKVTILSYTPFGILLGGYKIYSKITKDSVDRFVYHVAKDTSKRLLPVVTTIRYLGELVEIVRKFIERTREGDKNTDKFNLYRTELLRYIENLDDKLDNYVKFVDMVIKKKKDDDK
jgi:hypothetical protein